MGIDFSPHAITDFFSRLFQQVYGRPLTEPELTSVQDGMIAVLLIGLIAGIILAVWRLIYPAIARFRRTPEDQYAITQRQLFAQTVHSCLETLEVEQDWRDRRHA